MNILRFLGRRKSASAARERLQVLLAHERASMGGTDLVEILRKEIILNSAVDRFSPSFWWRYSRSDCISLPTFRPEESPAAVLGFCQQGISTERGQESDTSVRWRSTAAQIARHEGNAPQPSVWAEAAMPRYGYWSTSASSDPPEASEAPPCPERREKPPEDGWPGQRPPISGRLVMAARDVSGSIKRTNSDHQL